MTDPNQPHPRGRHSQPDAESRAGRPASELLAAWGTGADTLQADPADPADPALRSRRRRRYAPDTDAGGVRVLSPRGAVDVADVEITGLEATGIANVGLAAAGLDLSAFGIDPTPSAAPSPRRAGSAPAGAPAPVATPRTTEMPIPPAVPHLGGTGRRPVVDRRSAPAPRRAPDPSAPEPSTADRVAADRFADADTDPGWLSATGRPAPTPVRSRTATEDAGDAVLGSLAALFTDTRAPGAGVPSPAGPADLVTEVHPALSTGELARREAEDAAARRTLASRHRGADDEDGADADPQHPDEHDHDLPGDDHSGEDHSWEDHSGDGHGDDRFAPLTMGDRTGGLEVVVRGSDAHDDEHDEHHDDDLLGGGSGGGRRGGGRGGRGGGSGRPRKRRGPITVVLSLVVLVALVAGIGVAGLTLWRKINPVAEDYPGTGTGSVDIRVNEGDSLRAIGSTLVDADVIASADPFVDAAKANPAATSIQPGVYSMRLQMSGRSALDLLLDPASRQLSKVTLPEGLTVQQTLQRLADKGGLPLDQLQAAAADPASLGLPAYANGLLEGFLFPATYDIEPDQSPAEVLRAMVARTDQVLTDLQIPVDQRLTVLTKASIVQAEAGSVEDMGKVARVLENRLSDGMPLQLDTTVNYANGKSGLTTTAEDRANPSPYNTYLHEGLPPGAISNPGEEALRAVLNPTPGDWRFFVVINPDTGETRFAVTAAEHQQNVLLFQQWLQDHPGN